MAIFVVCPGCRKRFQVSERFAGRTGPCPQCKTPIHIPTPAEEVKIVEPDQVGPAGGSPAKLARLAKPIARREVQFQWKTAAAIAGGGLAVLLLAFLVRGVLVRSLIVRAVGLLLVSPPLVIGGYAFLHDDELEPYRGRALWVRSTILAVMHAALWGVAYLVLGSGWVGELWTWLVVVPPFLVAGALAAQACLDMEFGSAFFLYCFYLLTTIVLGWAGGLGWPWQVPEATSVL